MISWKLRNKLLTYYSKSTRLIRMFRFIKGKFPAIAQIINRILIQKENSNLFFHLNLLECTNISSTSLENVRVFASSRIIQLDESHATIVLAEVNKDTKSTLQEYFIQEEVIKVARVDVNQDRAFIFSGIPSMKLFGNWISMLDPTSGNWMHFLSEVLPNAIESYSSFADKQFGLLIDESIPLSAQQLIQTVFPETPLIVVHPGQSLEVQKLFVGNLKNKCGSYFWSRNEEHTLGAYKFNKDLLLLTKQTILRNIEIRDITLSGSSKIYLKRESYFRKMMNQDSIEKLLVENGFLVFTPDAHNLNELIFLLSNAKVVVAQAGAALANIMFMPKGSQVISLMADSEWVNYGYFEVYADLFDLKYTAIKGPKVRKLEFNISTTGSEIHPMNTDFYIDLSDLENQISI
jgi:hypothetical protein